MEKQASGARPQVAKPRTYTDEYRRQVADLVLSTGRTATSVAAEVGVHYSLVSRWVRRYGRPGSGAAAAPAASPRPVPASPLKPVPVPHADQAAEIARPLGSAEPGREVELLRTEREILKSCPAASSTEASARQGCRATRAIVPTCRACPSASSAEPK